MLLRVFRRLIVVCGLALVAVMWLRVAAWAQQLEPRAYSPAPIDVNFAGLTFLHASGGAALDASLPVKNTHVEIEALAAYYQRTFDLLGHQASFGMALPYAWVSGKATVQGRATTAQRSGPGDPAFRFATNLIGGPALTSEEFARQTPTTSLGTSLTMVAPFGQYFDNRLLNIGSNRWSFKPELGLSQPVGPWQLELSGGSWFFTDNDHYFRRSHREQDPIVTTQAHVGYTFRPGLWIAADATYYTGGRTTVNGIRNDDRQEATRIGLTLTLPIAEGYSLRLAWSDTVATRINGSEFTTYMATFQYTWFDR
ncbi:MAG TPA: transporter [Alphaproteobacteria bacterium]|jgi:hypothetical protein|nr:transporter [Alphaproteobacteria bacterium]